MSRYIYDKKKVFSEKNYKTYAQLKKDNYFKPS